MLPELAGKFAGLSVRVPTNNVSMVDLTVRLDRPAESKDALLHPLREAAAGRRKWSIAPLSNVIAVSDEELVSHDYLGREESCIVDVAATLMLDPHTFKVIAWVSPSWLPRRSRRSAGTTSAAHGEDGWIPWSKATLTLPFSDKPHACFVAQYDNEYAYSVRCLDLVKYMHKVDHGLASGAGTPFAHSSHQSLSTLVSA